MKANAFCGSTELDAGAPTPATRRARGVLACLAAAWLPCLMSSCSDAEPTPPHTDLGFLLGKIVASQPFVFPDRAWTGHAEGHWSFETSARLWCYFPAPARERLVFRLQSEESTAAREVRFAWDDEPLAEAPRTDATGTVLHIAPDRLQAGMHSLRLSAKPPSDNETPASKGVDAAPTEVTFGSLQWEIAGAKTPILPAAMPLHRYLAMFRMFGLTGIDVDRMGGCLFVEPGELTSPLALETDARTSFVVQNFSAESAAFTVEIADRRSSVEVEPLGSATLALDAPRGSHTLKMVVRGSAGGVFLWGSPYLQRPADPQPRSRATPVILVTLDTTRRDVLSPYGGPKKASPHIQKFADRATTYDNAYATSSWTLPAHGSMFTGLYPFRHGAGFAHNHLPASFHTLAEHYREHGYYTAGFAGGLMSSSWRGIGQGFLQFRDPDKGLETRGDRLNAAVAAALEQHHDKPLFLFINYFDPHALYRAPRRFEAKFGVAAHRQKHADRETWNLLQKKMRAWKGIVHGVVEATEEGSSYVRAVYLAEVAFMDHQIGQLFRMLRKHGLYDRALIVMIGDHGELLGEGGYYSHGNRLDPELVEIPLLIKKPGQKRAKRVSALASQVDVFPTLLEVLGGDVPETDGLSLAPDARAALAAREAVFMEEHDTEFHRLYPHVKIADHLYAVQKRRTREVLWESGGERQRREKGRWVVVPGDVDWPERLRQLGDWAWKPRPGQTSGGLSAEEQAQLKALGYAK